MKKKAILVITLSTFIYGNYKLLTRVSMTLFPFIAIYTMFLNMNILHIIIPQNGFRCKRKG